MPSQSSERTLLEIDVKRGIVHHVEAVAESAESRVKKGKSQAVASFALSLSLSPPPAPLSLSACSHSLLFVRSDSDYDEFDSSDQWGARGAGVSVRELLTCSHSDIAIMSLSLAPYLSLSFPPTPSPSPPLCVHSLCVLVVWLQVAGVSSCRR